MRLWLEVSAFIRSQIKPRVRLNLAHACRITIITSSQSLAHCFCTRDLVSSFELCRTYSWRVLRCDPCHAASHLSVFGEGVEDSVVGSMPATPPYMDRHPPTFTSPDCNLLSSLDCSNYQQIHDETVVDMEEFSTKPHCCRRVVPSSSRRLRGSVGCCLPALLKFATRPLMGQIKGKCTGYRFTKMKTWLGYTGYQRHNKWYHHSHESMRVAGWGMICRRVLFECCQKAAPPPQNYLKPISNKHLLSPRV